MSQRSIIPDVSPDLPLYFCHIPKTAGNTVHRFLAERYPANVICPPALWDGLLTMPRQKARSYSVYRGHFWGHLDYFLGRTTTKVTLVRDPVERTISHYAHLQAVGRHPPETLLDFARDPRWQHLIENFQCRYIAAERQNVELLASCFSATDFKAAKLQTILEMLAWPNSEELFDRAITALGEFAFVGTVESFDFSMAELSQRLDVKEYLPMEPLNKSANRKNINVESEAVDIIKSLTKADQRLHDTIRHKII